jgi:hypothetical protein
MTARPAWWPERRLNDRSRYVITVDGEQYGFTRRTAAALFMARLEVFTEKVALFRDRGRRAA